MFEKAIRLKLRFESAAGLLTLEDLWDLPLTSTRGKANLNDVARGISRQLKAEGEEDFVNQKSSGDTVLQLKLDIVKYVIQVRQQENEAAATAAERKAKKERLMELIARKQDQELEGKSLDELQTLAAELA